TGCVFFISFLVPLFSSAQVGATSVNNTRNFVRTWIATAPETDVNTLPGKGLKDVKQSTSYFDGLGRPEQTVLKQGSLTTAGSIAADIVTPQEYDQYGKEVKKYLPFVASTNDGNYKADAITAQTAFNQSWYSAQQENTF